MATQGSIYLGALGDVDRNPRPTMRGWTAPPTNPTDWKRAFATILDDGSVTLANSAGGQRSGPQGETLPPSQVDAVVLESYVADLFSMLLSVGGADGVLAYDLRVGVECTANLPEPIQFWGREGNSTYLHDTRTTLQRVAPVRATVPMEENVSAQARDVALDLINQGGVLTLRVIPTV